LDFRWSPGDATFRDEVRQFLEARLTPEMRAATAKMTSVYAHPDLSLAWQRILHARGWAAPAWPKAFGGCGWSLTERYIFASELAEAGAPPLSPMGLGMCGPILIAHGTDAQRRRFLPPMLAGEELWCQGYSEPAAGSDLAALAMSAREDGEDFICDGQKIWTTHANFADWIFCLVRTAAEDIPQKGISFLLIDMKTRGVEAAPIVSLTGEHIQNQVFFSGVKVPKANVVGAVGQGWTVAKHLMQFERGGSVTAPGMKVRLRRLEALIAGLEGEEARGLARAAAALGVELAALEATELRVMSRLSQGAAPGPESSLLKLTATELSQRIAATALVAVGTWAAPFQPHATAPGGPTPGAAPANDGFAVGPPEARTATAKYLNDRAGTIYAGSSEIQKNIMAKAVLGL
jgi:alkylation response protein AidB-like acyl-CoA dehydrogenase